MIGTALALRETVRSRPGLALMAIGAIAALSWCWGVAVGRSGIHEAKAAVQRQCDARQEQALAEASRRREEDRHAGDRAAGELRQTLTLRDQRIKELLRRSANAPAIVATPACPAPGDVHLSVSAVRLYDTALGGFDQQLLTSSARTAGAGDATGLPGSEAGRPEDASQVDVTGFIQVAQANASSFGECRVRMARLVDFIRSREIRAVSPNN